MYVSHYILAATKSCFLYLILGFILIKFVVLQAVVSYQVVFILRKVCIQNKGVFLQATFISNCKARIHTNPSNTQVFIDAYI